MDSSEEILDATPSRAPRGGRMRSRLRPSKTATSTTPMAFSWDPTSNSLATTSSRLPSPKKASMAGCTGATTSSSTGFATAFMTGRKAVLNISRTSEQPPDGSRPRKGTFLLSTHENAMQSRAHGSRAKSASLSQIGVQALSIQVPSAQSHQMISFERLMARKPLPCKIHARMRIGNKLTSSFVKFPVDFMQATP